MSALLAAGCWLFFVWLIVAGHRKVTRPTPRPMMSPADSDWVRRARLIGELEDQMLLPSRERRERRP